jgi:predicted lipopolysaccharide heptosyltransferase III
MIPHKILIIKLRYIGDVLLATPVFAALRAQFPDSHLTALVNPGTEGVLQHNPHLDETWVLERGDWREQLRFLRRLRARRFDCVIDLTDGDRSAVLAWASGASCRIGFNDEQRWRGRCYTQVAVGRDPTRHRIQRDLSTLEPLGIVAPPAAPMLLTSADDDQRAVELLRNCGVTVTASGIPGSLVLLQPGARYWFKAWPAERFAALADLLAARLGCHVVIGGSAQERALGERIAQLSQCAPLVLSGKTSVPIYAALLKRAALAVTNDNGLMHMAAAVGTPVVALFGPSHPAEWGPLGTEAEVLYKGLDCRACFHPTCTRGDENCMKLIAVDEVFAAAARLLAQREQSRG